MESSNLEGIASSDEAGAETLRRYRYQAQYAALKSLDMVRQNAKMTYLYCEHHQDILVKLKNGEFVAIQVKTKEIGQPFFRTNEKSVLASIASFWHLERNHPKSFSHFVFATNYRFQQKQDGSNLGFILEEVRGDEFSAEFLFVVRALADSLLSYGVSAEESDFIRFLRKIKLEDRLPYFSHMQGEIIRTVATIPGFENASYQSLRLAAKALKDFAMEAGEFELPHDHSAIFNPNFEQDIESQIIRRKQINRDDVVSILEKVSLQAAIPDGPTSAITRQQLQSNLSFFREELVSYQQFLRAHVSVEELSDWADRYGPPFDINPAVEFLNLALKVGELLEQSPHALLEELSMRRLWINSAVLEGLSTHIVRDLIKSGSRPDRYAIENAVRLVKTGKRILECDPWKLFGVVEIGTSIEPATPALGILGEYGVEFRSLAKPVQEVARFFTGLERFDSVETAMLSGVEGVLCYGQRRITFWNPQDATGPTHQFELPLPDRVVTACTYSNRERGCHTYVIGYNNVYVLEDLVVQASHPYNPHGVWEMCALRSSRVFAATGDGVHNSIIEIFDDAHVRTVVAWEKLQDIISKEIKQSAAQVSHPRLKSVVIGGQNLLLTKFSVNMLNSILLFWRVIGAEFELVSSLYFPGYRMVSFDVLSVPDRDLLVCTGVNSKDYPERMYCYDLKKHSGTFRIELIRGYLSDWISVESFVCLSDGVVFATDGRKLAKVDVQHGTSDVVEEVGEDHWLGSSLFLWVPETR
jgi:hypothetical protein